ncbi:endonuclease/exonuclease/phosphatase family protein [Nocardia carnea]|uniref:Endonuclease/exonuclease/phosphatase family protein n=1 Tax=Nocardia carnea TaxID=37328 RepID=A0ABW7TGF3_9NOCA|nr:endonuclease/exonuclease/phosphatase family protein [Nocardia carnea]
MRHGVYRRVLLGAGWCALFAALAGIALYLGGWQRRELILLASGATYLMLGALAALLLFLFARGWRSAVAAGIVLTGVLWTQVPLYVPDSNAATGTELTVLQTNLLFGGADTDAVVAAVREQQVDVLTVDELTPDSVSRLTVSGIDAFLPYHYLDPGLGGGGTGIYSRFPLSDTVRHQEFVMANLSGTLTHPAIGPVTVFAFHPLPPNIDHRVWLKELAAAATILEATEGPAVVGADFNATSDHAAFRKLVSGRFAAAAEQAGAGRMLTYPNDRSWGPVIGIDHILVAGGTTDDIETLTIPGSDHRAVLARLRLSA